MTHRLLSAYDDQLRTDAEVAGARAFTTIGPLYLAVVAAGRGFVTYRDLGGADQIEVRRLVKVAVEHFAAMPEVTEFEWKTRGHDVAPGLGEALLEYGFAAGEPESIMVGEAAGLVTELPPPVGVSLHQITERDEITAMVAMQREVFSEDISTTEVDRAADEVWERLGQDEAMQLWVARADGEVVSAGQLRPVAGTGFAGIWGGSTRPEWRGRGIYLALTAARARAAIRLGKRYIHSDSTEYSRPILERSGLVKVSTTTPYVWHRPTR